MRIFVGNINSSTTDDRLRREFERFGTVEELYIHVSRNSGGNRRYAFVTMPDDDASTAIARMNNFILDGSKLRVNRAKPRSEGRRDGGGVGRQKVQVSGGGAGSFINPYNFIPVTKVDRRCLTRYLGDGPHFQDRYRAGGYSGRIVCEITTESEVFIGAGSVREGSGGLPASLLPFELNGDASIPATSLKGMISSIMEAASNSALRVLDEERIYTRRQDLGSDTLYKIGMIVEREGKKMLLPLKTRRRYNFRKNLDLSCPVYIDGYSNGKETGLLKRRNELDYSASGKFYYLDTRKIEYKTKKDFLLGYRIKDHEDDPFISEDRFNQLPQADRGYYKKGLFKILGVGSRRQGKIPSTKKHEFFLFYRENQCLDISGAEGTFNLLSDDRSFHNRDDMEEEERLPYTPRGRKRQRVQGKDGIRLKSGDIVYYSVDRANSQVVARVSFSACWRDFCGGKKSGPSDYFSAMDNNGFLLPPFMRHQGITDPKKLQLTPVSTLMGFVEEKRGGIDKPGLALAGRLFFSHAILSPDQDRRKVRGAKRTLRILDSPKPPCPEFYFHKRSGKDSLFIDKKMLKVNGNILPNGRKFYLHHNSSSPGPYAPDDDYIKKYYKQISEIAPIRQGTRFLFSIDFFNVTEFELGMLLYALRPTRQFRHLIGMGKPIGLGMVRLDILNLLFVDRKRRYGNESIFAKSFFHTMSSPNMTRINEIKDNFSGKRCRFYRERFCSLADDAGGVDISTFIDHFKSEICGIYGDDWLQRLENIQDPGFTDIEGTPVQYPNLSMRGYSEAFRWWVNNSRESGQKTTLGEISKDKNKKAPTLPFNPS